MSSQSPWFEFHVDLRDHPKTDLLMDLLAITRRDAVGLLSFVWGRAMLYAPSGDLSDFTDGQIARWADWDGDPGHLVSALKTAGFLDAQRTLHDWQAYAGRWIDRRNADADRKRKAREVAAGRVNGSHPEMSGRRPPGRRPESGVPDLTGPDLNRTGPDRTDLPLPPPPAEGELAKPTKGDAKLWKTARERLRSDMSPANWDQLVEPLAVLGRAPDGGLWLRAPPGQRIGQRVINGVRKALLDAGDGLAAQSAIVED